MSSPTTPLCPSAQPDWPDAQVFALVTGSVDEPRAAYLAQAEPVTSALLAMAGPVAPTEVFRTAGRCQGGSCQHFDTAGDSCNLVRKTVALAPAVVQTLPRCAIRRDCKWWLQEGMHACQRCPQVVTLNYTMSPALREAADPQTH